jgi:8-oxo-dGTP pyrophosphatase MutT (NUDIX family)
VHVEAFLVDVEPGWEPELNDEHDDYRWLRREEAAELFFWPEPAALLRSLP